ncbi:hypothetical protein [Kibdelosporangium phytohabitans]|uniref:Uncharacterized protein n=1 Tax=Kibdelosporangium phytohabitans TaxID=860235 RepID=A0A0N9HPW7_9PSEU|nr:hypothetical protein [Kibdelosporangium phytohabitans]ALG06698.1 hypothetical protein AOZ06_06935 [Kibdelosporangium phytohabitans]MBE1467916.1 hypothetical protein [Kibdelosporangium phytohabitans]
MDIDFFAAIVRTGTVLGADAGMSPQEVSRYLGDDPWDEESGGVLRWDYGLVEFCWDVKGSRFELELHRLTVSVPFEDLRARVALVAQEDSTFVHPTSGVAVHVRDGLVTRIVSTRGGRRGLDIPGDRLPAVFSAPGRYADIVESGTVLGVDADLDPSVVRRVFGEFGYRNVNEPSFWWGYGILEIFWHKRPNGLGAQGSHFTVQCHRLGAIGRRLRWTDLRAELDRRGVALVELTGYQPDPDYTEYLQPDSMIVVMVYLPDDEVHVVQSRFRMRDPNRDWSDWQAVTQSLKHALTLSPDERIAWIERKRPDEDAAGWWHQRCQLATGHACDSGAVPDHGDWVAFAFWAWELAHTLGVPPAVVAREVAAFTGALEDHHPEFDRPTADSVVQSCLEHITGAMDRTDKDLLTAAALHRHAVQDPSLLAALDRWIAIRTDLPSVSLPRW